MVQELGDRVVIKFVTFEGEELELVGYEGESLMQVAKRGDAPSILATCGGNCEVSGHFRFFSFSSRQISLARTRLEGERSGA